MSVVDELIAVLGFEITGEANAKRFEARIDGLSRGLDKFAITAGRMAGAATLAMAAGFRILGKSVIETSAQFEGYLATLETIEGSAEKARSSLDWIAEFGKTTPYDLAQVTEAFVSLKAYGIDPIVDDALRTLGDTASAMGKPLTQAVEAFADAATGEFERLKEFGIRAKQQGEEVTFSWTKNGEELTRTIKKNSTDIRAFLLETMGDRFSGAMDRQSRTWNGMMSNLGDTWVDFKRRIGDAGFFDVASANLQKLLDYASTLDADGTLDRWAENLSSVLTQASDFIGLVAQRIAANIEFIVENFEQLEPVLTSIAAVLGLLIMRLRPGIALFIILSLAVDDFLAYMQNGESYIGDFIKQIQNLTGVSEGVAKGLAGLGAVVLTALGAAFLLAPAAVIKTFGRLLFNGLALLAPLILKGAVAAFGLLSNPVGWAVLLAGVAAGLIYYFWDDIKAAWEATKSYAIKTFSRLKDWILGIDWAGMGSDMMTSMWDGMKSIGTQITDWFVGLIPDWAKPFIDGLAGIDSGPKTSNVRGAITSAPNDPSAVMGVSRPVSLTEDAFDYKMQLQAEEWERVQSNLSGNMQRMLPDTAVDTVITDARQDNRQFPQTNNVTINQNVTSIADAVRGAASATGAAVLNAVPSRSQAGMEPSF